MQTDDTLNTLIELTRQRLEQAGRTLADLDTRRRSAQGQLHVLDGYRLDYTQRLQNTTAQGVSASNYHNFRQFIATLDQAISQQNRAIVQLDAHLQNQRQQWQDEKRRLNSYETLKERRLRQQRDQERRREQRESDEIAAARARRQPSIHQDQPLS